MVIVPNNSIQEITSKNLKEATRALTKFLKGKAVTMQDIKEFETAQNMPEGTLYTALSWLQMRGLVDLDSSTKPFTYKLVEVSQ